MRNQNLFIKRRSILGLMSSVLAFGLARPALAETDPLRQVIARLSDDAPIRFLGCESAGLTGFDGTLEVLLSHLSNSLDLAGVSMTDANAVYDGLRHCISADFAKTRTISIDGWILSQTEVTAYLAAYIYHRQASAFV